jgi:hypothetical protein
MTSTTFGNTNLQKRPVVGNRDEPRLVFSKKSTKLRAQVPVRGVNRHFAVVTVGIPDDVCRMSPTQFLPKVCEHDEHYQ